MEDQFKNITGFKSYISKPELTNVSPQFMCRGSKNVLLDYGLRIISRNGYILYGAAASDGSTGIKRSYEWDTSSNKQFPLRVWGSVIEFYYNATWNTLKSGLVTPYLEFAKVLDYTEQIDVLLWVMNDSNIYKWSGGVTKVASSTGTTLTKQGVLTGKTTIAFVAGTTGTVAPTITDSANGFLTAGFTAGDTLYVSGSTANSRNFTIGSVTAGTITLIMSDVLVSEAAGPSITVHNGEPTWASSRFLSSGTRAITYNGVSYTYTGGQGTDTLTGLTSFPSVTAGDMVFQTVITVPLPSSITSSFPNFTPDLIGVQLNQVVLASTKSMMIFGSSTTDYTNFTVTSPRVPGGPFQKPINDNATCIIPVDNDQQSINSLMIGSGKNSFYHIFYQLSQDNSTELVNLVRLKTATGSGLIATGAIGAIKNSTVYITREPTLDTISSLESVNSTPISDPVKNDFDTYNFTGAHLKYWKRSIYIALPASGVVLIYDLQRKLWQPPQTVPIGRFAIIGDWLYGHSSVSNESYKLFTGTNDNGNYIPQVARFAYNNGGKRDLLKNASQLWSDGYITPNGLLNMNFYAGFEGVAGKKIMPINGGDTSITNPVGGSPLGDEPLGATPIGGDNLDAVTGLPGTNATMLRFYQDDTMAVIDHIENFVEFTMDTLDAQFALVGYGSNLYSAGTAHVTHKK
jgi:hypothetical protein